MLRAMITYDYSIKIGNRYKYKTKTFDSDLHFSRWYDKVSASGVKIIDIIKKA